MYKTRDSLIFGFHGCDESLCDKLVSGQITALNYSENSYDWLGKGTLLFADKFISSKTKRRMSGSGL